MSTRKAVLKILEGNRAVYISGEQIATDLGLSRTAIWKAINRLKEEGYEIESVTNKGYRLKQESDVLSPEGIQPWLLPTYQGIELRVHKRIDSTNQEAKKLGVEGAKAGTVILAEEQTQGRGRMGRFFYSPAQSGIYLSILLRPDVQGNESVLLTTGAAVGVYRAIKKVTGLETQIKWVNDLYFGGQKIVGILTEAVTNFENGRFEFVIIGIGLNFEKPEEIPPEFQGIVGSLFDKKPDTLTRNRLAAEIINAVMAICEDVNPHDFLLDYKAHSMVIGKEIEIFRHNESEVAKAIDISESGGLVIEHRSGVVETLNTGEVSIRPLPEDGKRPLPNEEHS